jgi:hypothetical protein
VIFQKKETEVKFSKKAVVIMKIREEKEVNSSIRAPLIQRLG